jgi:cytochrome c5
MDAPSSLTLAARRPARPTKAAAQPRSRKLQLARAAPVKLIHAALLALLAACGESAATRAAAHQQLLQRAQGAQPADPRLATLYQQSCRSCHAVENSGAPLARDTDGWAERWSRGLASLQQSVITGKNGMPAGGQCFACSAADYEALIRFLAGRD